MALGTYRPRNWGAEQQMAALNMICKSGRVGYKLRTTKRGGLMLGLYKTDGVYSLPVEFECELANVRKGKWESLSTNDGCVLACGISQRDVIRATIQKVWA
jgi:hypothetical protein